MVHSERPPRGASPPASYRVVTPFLAPQAFRRPTQRTRSARKARGCRRSLPFHVGSEPDLERMTRDVQLMTIGGGRSEIHRNMIVEQLLSAG